MLRRYWTAALLVALIAGMAAGYSPAYAQDDSPQSDAPGLILFTRFPSQEVALEDNVTFELKLRTGGEPRTVRLGVQDLPEGWAATFRGGGRVIQSAYVDSTEDVTVELELTPPDNVAARAYGFSVVALGQNNDNVEANLPIELTVKEKLPPRLEFEVELPTLNGTPETTFRYNATLKNESDEDANINLVAEAP